jgi:ribose transport system permease protein
MSGVRSMRASSVRSASLPNRQQTVGWLSRNGVFFALLFLVVYFSLASERFFSASNFEVVLVQTAIIGVVAVPGAMLVLSGYVDLSVGSVTVLSAIIFGRVFDSQDSIFLGVVAAMVVAIVCGLVTATLVAYFEMSPIIVTLGGLAAARGVAEVISRGETVFGFGPGFAELGNGELLSIRLPSWIFLAVVAVGAYVWYQSPYGRHMMAIGANRDAAHSLGIGVKRLPFILYVVSAAACGLAGLLYASRLDGASLSIGDGMELQVLTAILLGGVAFTGGRGSLLGVVCGLLFVSVLTNGLAQLDVSTYWVNIALGAALITAAGIDVLYQRLERLPPPDIDTDPREIQNAPAAHP